MFFGRRSPNTTSTAAPAAEARAAALAAAAQPEAAAAAHATSEAQRQLADLTRAMNAALLGLRDLRDQSQDTAPDYRLPAELDARLRDLRTVLCDSLSGLDREVFRSATGVARNSVQMSNLTLQMQKMHQATTDVLESTRQVRGGAEEVAKAATETSALTDDVSRASDEGKAVTLDAVASIHQLRDQMAETAQRFSGLIRQIQMITQVTDVIGGIAGRTNLLALNAAIEAARAGAAGRGFAVVADEIRKLAEHTATRTKEINTLVQSVIAEAEPGNRAIGESMDLVHTGTAKVEAAKAALDQIDEYIRRAAGQMQSIAAAVEEQTAATESMIDGLQTVGTQMDVVSDATRQVAASTFQLSEVTESVYRHLAPFRTDTIFHVALELGRELVSQSRQAMEEAIARGQVTLAQLLDLKYTEIKGDEIRSLSRLFDVSRVPRTGFNPPKYRTAYDAALEEPLQRIYDAIMAREKRLTFALMLDLNAYVPAHNRICCQDWTGDYARDNAGNRVKRLYHDNPVLLRGSRMGLNAAAMQLRPMATRQEFARAGCSLHEPAGGTGEFLVQTYARDTGAVTSALSIPVYIRGERWGSAFLGWEADERF